MRRLAGEVEGLLGEVISSEFMNQVGRGDWQASVLGSLTDSRLYIDGRIHIIVNVEGYQ